MMFLLLLVSDVNCKSFEVFKQGFLFNASQLNILIVNLIFKKKLSVL